MSASFETPAAQAPQDDEWGGIQTSRHGEERAEGPRLEPRTDILAIARTWLGTPYRHQASLRGVGCDCLGLVRGVWRALYGAEPETPPAYRPDWAEVGGRETLLAGARRHLVEVRLAEVQPGDVLLFRMAADSPVKHCAILTALPTVHDPQPRMIHAYWGRAVVESWIGPWWARRLAFGFAFPPFPIEGGRVGDGGGRTTPRQGASEAPPAPFMEKPMHSPPIPTFPPSRGNGA